jgi:uncharacterized protein YgiB involved in biofilm formation
MPDKQPRRRFASAHRPRLVLGGIAAAGLTLSGCSSEPAGDARFTTVSECTSAGFDQSLCQGGYDDARKTYLNSAPRFTSLADCEKEWGDKDCAPMGAASMPATAGASSGSVFVPLFAGFVLSSMMQRNYYSTGYYSGGYIGSPIYRTRSGSSVTLDRGSGGIVKATPVNVNTSTVSRSGFGGMSMSRGSSFGG